MTEPLYGMPVLRLAAALADHPPLADADVRGYRPLPVGGRRPPDCGSTWAGSVSTMTR